MFTITTYTYFEELELSWKVAKQSKRQNQMPRWFTILEMVSDRYSIACQKEVTVSLCLQDSDLHKRSRFKKQQRKVGERNERFAPLTTYVLESKITPLNDEWNTRHLIRHYRLGNKNITLEVFQVKRVRIVFLHFSLWMKSMACSEIRNYTEQKTKIRPPIPQ